MTELDECYEALRSELADELTGLPSVIHVASPLGFDEAKRVFDAVVRELKANRSHGRSRKETQQHHDSR